jgi:hypothetical protein
MMLETGMNKVFQAYSPRAETDRCWHGTSREVFSQLANLELA